MFFISTYVDMFCILNHIGYFVLIIGYLKKWLFQKIENVKTVFIMTLKPKMFHETMTWENYTTDTINLCKSWTDIEVTLEVK